LPDRAHKGKVSLGSEWGEALEWPELPEFLHGEMTFVVSAVDPGTELDIVIHEVAQDASCTEEPQEPASAPPLS
jgi:hypothetical protein